ncbi:hypothetical protein NP233_g5801 [Leucocoprinus birnbaumii]|uniref:NACHT domain-containing protein n=1 Tax=Leucocoprinus birnbaumii TaxID=56174 RepID=A0AAD5VS63_9AGAR|nr:hypothetical protein NP233_g5801 [Leucocoprinus birnbaumii]
MYTLVALVSILTFVNAAPSELSGRSANEQTYCCDSLKNPTFFSFAAPAGINAGNVGYNCTLVNSVACARQTACCSGVVEARSAGLTQVESRKSSPRNLTSDSRPRDSSNSSSVRIWSDHNTQATASDHPPWLGMNHSRNPNPQSRSFPSSFHSEEESRHAFQPPQPVRGPRFIPLSEHERLRNDGSTNPFCEAPLGFEKTSSGAPQRPEAPHSQWDQRLYSLGISDRRAIRRSSPYPSFVPSSSINLQEKMPVASAEPRVPSAMIVGERLVVKEITEMSPQGKSAITSPEVIRPSIKNLLNPLVSVETVIQRQSLPESLLSIPANRSSHLIPSTRTESGPSNRLRPNWTLSGNNQHGYPLIDQDIGTNIFTGAHDIAINGSTFNVINTSQAQAQLERSEALIWLRTSMLDGAEHDSADRDPPPRCHPGTRTTILQRTHQWIDDPNREKRLLWVRGPAGVGKSAIVQTLADILSATQRLGASLFFSRPNGRSNPQLVFPTIAYQLAVRDAAYREYIDELRLLDSRPLELKAMKEQFRLLFVEPFVNRMLRDGQDDLLIAIDGLDECGGEPHSSDHTFHHKRSLEEVHCDIIQLIAGFVRDHPSIPLIWIIASRPESHIKAIFLSGDVNGSYREEDIPVDSDEACRDVEVFLHASFKNIQEKYRDRIREDPWPNSAKFLQITRAASGLFVFAEVVIRFIGDPNIRKPIAQLEYVLAALANLQVSRSARKPLSVLDAIYTAILSRVPSDVLNDTKQVLSILLRAHRNTSVTFREIYEHLEITQEDAIMALDHLHSVIFFSGANVIETSRPLFYHASFRDFLKDPTRSGDYAVKEWPFDLLRYLPNMFDREPCSVENLPSWEDPWPAQQSWRLLETILTNLTSSPLGVSIEFMSFKYFIPTEQLRSVLSGLNFRKILFLSKFNEASHLLDLLGSKVSFAP